MEITEKTIKEILENYNDLNYKHAKMVSKHNNLAGLVVVNGILLLITFFIVAIILATR